MDSTDKNGAENDNESVSEVEKEDSFIEKENPMDEGKPPQADKTKQDDTLSAVEKSAEEENESSKPSGSSKKQGGRKKKTTTILPSTDEAPVSSDNEQEAQTSKVKDRPNNPWVRRKAILRQSRPVSKPQKTENDRSKSRDKVKTKKSAPPKPTQLTDSTSEETDDKPTTADVKQFSFPQYKILSGATVAAVKMRPQKLVIRRTIDEYDDSKHWAVGLFQPTMMSLKLRLLRLLLVWLFFRVLNKQTSWLSDKMSIGMMDEPPTPPPPRSTQPGERYIKVFHESSPHPIHVRVRRPP